MNRDQIERVRDHVRVLVSLDLKGDRMGIDRGIIPIMAVGRMVLSIAEIQETMDRLMDQIDKVKDPVYNLAPLRGQVSRCARLMDQISVDLIEMRGPAK
jgi:hypothetical protein